MAPPGVGPPDRGYEAVSSKPISGRALNRLLLVEYLAVVAVLLQTPFLIDRTLRMKLIERIRVERCELIKPGLKLRPGIIPRTRYRDSLDKRRLLLLLVVLPDRIVNIAQTKHLSPSFLAWENSVLVVTYSTGAGLSAFGSAQGLGRTLSGAIDVLFTELRMMGILGSLDRRRPALKLTGPVSDGPRRTLPPRATFRWLPLHPVSHYHR